MKYLYNILLHLLFPVLFLRLLWRSIKSPNYRKRWLERLGFVNYRQLNKSLWIHAVSVGEVQAAEFLVKRLQEQYPQTDILITTTTPTGSARVEALFGNSVFHSYLPFDYRWGLSRFIAHADPQVLILMETEIWPNLLSLCDESSVTTILANARLSERSARGYQRFSKFSHQIFSKLTMVAAQSKDDAQRFIALGVSSENVQVTGSVKFDIKIPASQREQAEVVRHSWGGDRLVWVAASTHEGEDEQVLEVHQRLLEGMPELLLVLVPRHPERFDRVTSLVSSMGFIYARRSRQAIVSTDTQVYVGDTMGELLLFLAASDAAFVGGSLVNTGGHNVLEASMFGVPVCFGPHMFNFQAISEMLLAQNAAIQVSNKDELYQTMDYWVRNASERTKMGDRGLSAVEKNRGALDKLTQIIIEKIE